MITFVESTPLRPSSGLGRWVGAKMPRGGVEGCPDPEVRIATLREPGIRDFALIFLCERHGLCWLPLSPSTTRSWFAEDATARIHRVRAKNTHGRRCTNAVICSQCPADQGGLSDKAGNAHRDRERCGEPLAPVRCHAASPPSCAWSSLALERPAERFSTNGSSRAPSLPSTASGRQWDALPWPG